MQNRRDFLKTIAFSTAGIALLPRFTFAGAAGPWDTVYPQILARIKPPVFAKRDFVSTKYGAVQGSANDSTAAIAKAIDDCNKAGGGRVIVPAGEFLTAAVHLKSNVNLYISKGATLKFSTDASKY